MSLVLLPNLLTLDSEPHAVLPNSVWEWAKKLDGLFAESEKEGRRFLSRFETKRKASEIPIALINEHTQDRDLDFFLDPLKKGEIWGFVSDAGLPLLADPGHKLVARAKEREIKVIAIPGPSSIILALQLSGLPSQRFSFHGYIAKNQEQRKKELREWERASKTEKSTHVFIEAPYRNLYTFEEAVNTLNERTLLTVGWDLTGPEENVTTLLVKEWRKREKPPIEKIPAIFLLYAL